jgi:hypothetical protein
MNTVLQAISVLAAFVSAMCLYYGSLGVPSEEETWNGQSAREVAVKRRQVVLKWIGIPAAILALACQLWLIFI